MSDLAIKGGAPVREKPFPKWPIYDRKEIRAIREVLHSGVWGLGGAKKKELEDKFAAYQDAKYGVAVTSGTTALATSLKALEINVGDEVVLPAYTFMATPAAILETGALPVFADINPETYTVDPEKVKCALSDKTKAILPVHIAGCPADMDEISRIARKNSLFIVEDACQAWGARWRDKKVGAIGDLGAFSFQSSKNITSGEGGIVITNDKKLYELCWSYHNCGRLTEGARYHHDLLGLNYRMTEFQAAILLVQLGRLPTQTAKRNKNANYLTEQLSRIEGIKPLKRDVRVTTHAYHLYIFKYSASDFDGLPREKFIEALRMEGIPCSPGYTPLHKEKFMLDLRNNPFLSREYGKKMDYRQFSLPNTEDACLREAVWLYQYMLLGTKEDMDDIVMAITKIKHNANRLL